MIKNLTAPKLSLSAIEKTLGSTQKLSATLQSNLKGGGVGEDLRRPPVIGAVVAIACKLI